jgi:hypothetical protein
VPAVLSALELPGFFDIGTRRMNAGHFAYHPLTGAFLISMVVLPPVFLMVLLRKKTFALISMVIVGYIPVYVACGWWVWGVPPVLTFVLLLCALTAVIAAAETILYFSWRRIRRGGQQMNAPTDAGDS